MTVATLFNEREAEACYVARLIEDARTYWVAGGGGPMYSVLLAQRMGYAPNAVYMTEDGVVAPEPMLPFDPIQTMVSARAGYRALQWGTMNTAQDYARSRALRLRHLGHAAGRHAREHQLDIPRRVSRCRAPLWRAGPAPTPSPECAGGRS